MPLPMRLPGLNRRQQQVTQQGDTIMSQEHKDVKLVLMDIEGTTTRMQFVHEVLFPYAQRKLPEYLRQPLTDEAQQLLNAVKSEMPEQSVEDTLLNWMQKDIKHPLLKTLQGWLWKAGYLNGELQGHVYDDVLSAFQRWTQMGLTLGIYSSGSVLAQQLLFGYSIAGDLRSYLTYHFDTTVGSKRQAASYHAIAKAVDLPAEHILFLSDIAEELDAAAQTGMIICQLRRADHPCFRPGDQMPCTSDFSSIALRPKNIPS
jgi:enolase-phosphatase E1